MTCPRSHSCKSHTDSQVLYHQSGILRPPPTPTEHGLGRKGYLDIECLVCWTEEQGRGPDARLRARQRPACAWVPRAQGGMIQRLPLPAHGWNRTVLFCSRPAAPREEHVCPGALREGLGWVPAKGAGTGLTFLQIGHNDSNPNPTYLI